MGRPTVIRMDLVVHPVNHEEIVAIFIEDWNELALAFLRWRAITDSLLEGFPPSEC